MQHMKHKIIRIFSIALLAVFLHMGINVLLGFLPTETNVNLASAQTVQQPLIFSAFQPANKVEDDTEAVEVGVKFRTTVDGQISAIRFYRGKAIDSGYKINLWTYPDCVNLKSEVLIQGQQPTPGWQIGQIYPPVDIKAGQVYIASYYARNGEYAEDQGYFSSPISNGPVYFLKDGEEGPNSVFVYADGGGCPTQGHNGSNYWLDVVFTPKPTTTTPTS